jgi:hypothetical protein
MCFCGKQFLVLCMLGIDGNLQKHPRYGGKQMTYSKKYGMRNIAFSLFTTMKS